MNKPNTTDLSADVLDGARQADIQLRPHVMETPLLAASWLGHEMGSQVSLKLETLQVTGSFKFRGALNKLLTIPELDRMRGVVAASTGNHGAAVAEAGSRLGAPVHVFVPESAAAPKLARMTKSGAQITQVPGDSINAERAARRHAEESHLTYVSPYNDATVVAGQATIGLELLRQCATPPDAIFVALGGGGLSAGIAISAKSAWPETRVIACSPSNSAVMIQSIEAGQILDLPSIPSLSDGTGGGIENGTITFDLCRSWIDEFVTISEDEIRESMVQVVEKELVLIEGAAAVAVAGYQKRASRYRESGSAVIILSGANVSRDTLLSVLSRTSLERDG